MPYRLIRLLPAILLLFAVSSLQAEPLPIPQPPSTGAKAFILQDFDSGRIIAEQDADKPVDPASITKLMTAYAVFKELRSGKISLSDMVTISETAWRTPGSRMFVEVGKQVSVEDLLQGMIIQSGNDATVALAEYVAGSEDELCRPDEPACRDTGNEGQPLHEFHRPDGPRASHDGARHRPSCRDDHPGVSGILQVVFPEGVHLQRHHAIQPQQAAVARCDGGRHEDRAHRVGRLLPGNLGQEGRHAPDQRGPRYRERERARRRQSGPAQLRLPFLRDA